MPEQQNIEYKQSWHDEILKWVCGFANAQGGLIFIGKDDNGNVVGIDNYKKLMDDLPNKIRNTMGISAEVNLHEEKGKYFIVVVLNIDKKLIITSYTSDKLKKGIIEWPKT